MSILDADSQAETVVTVETEKFSPYKCWEVIQSYQYFSCKINYYLQMKYIYQVYALYSAQDDDTILSQYQIQVQKSSLTERVKTEVDTFPSTILSFHFVS